jgi:G:T-mismatch repair DNA endonuclease (very short patch repair protein)
MNRTYCPIPDIYIPNKKIVIEIYGDRWHMNPMFYKETDIVRFFIGERSGRKTWDHDKTRIAHIESFGITVLTIWEYDIKMNFETTMEQVLNFYDSI